MEVYGHLVVAIIVGVVGVVFASIGLTTMWFLAHGYTFMVFLDIIINYDEYFYIK